jgi:16S rRNA (guanine527-N7)-methyltransferase
MAGRQFNANGNQISVMTDEISSALTTALRQLGIDPLSKEQLQRLATHYSMMCIWNRRVNLTRITDPSEAARLHYAESLLGARYVGPVRTAVDIGSGAGFPGVPIAVVKPELQVTALEANQKKCTFLNEVKDALGLANLSVLHGRVERSDLEGFELLTTRALDRSERLLPGLLASLHPPQRFLLFCANDLIAHIEAHLPPEYRLEAHPIPQTRKRLIALVHPVG